MHLAIHFIHAVAVGSPYICKDGISLLDGLAATGLRSVRYLKEIPGIRQMIVNDISVAATKTAQENFVANGVFDPNKVRIENKDATLLMYEHRDPLEHFDVIDIDPYGTAAPFLDSAVQVSLNELNSLSNSLWDIIFIFLCPRQCQMEVCCA